MDGYAWGLLASVVVAIVSTGGVVASAHINSKREKINTAEATADEIQEKRLLLRDEQNEHLRRKNSYLQAQLDECLQRSER